MSGLRGPERIDGPLVRSRALAKDMPEIKGMRGIPRQIKRLLQHFGGLNNVRITSLQLNQALEMKGLGQKIRAELDRLPYDSEVRKLVRQQIDVFAKKGLMLHIAERKPVPGSTIWKTGDLEECLRDAFIPLYGIYAFERSTEKADNTAVSTETEEKAPEPVTSNPPAIPVVVEEKAPQIAVAESIPVVRGKAALKSISPERLNELRKQLKLKVIGGDTFDTLHSIEELGPAAADLIPDLLEFIKPIAIRHWYDLFTGKQDTLVCAIDALRSMGPAASQTYSVLLDLLVKGNHPWRPVYHACWALKYIDKKAAEADIFSYFKDAKRSADKRWPAAYFLSEAFTDNNGIGPALVAFLADPKSDATGRRLLLENLMKRIVDWKNTEYYTKYYPNWFKASLAGIVPALREMKKDRDEELRKTAGVALNICEPILKT